ncbi:MAG: 50S ribosomal protein L10 [Bacteroidaceae bacterium]|nr:50S ribosomal protein L10 [Bacteroidaceae bacterium]
MRKEDKAIIIEQLGEKLKEYAHFYIVDVTGLNAETTSNLRRKCFASDVKMIVAKNTLLEKAFDNAEVDYSALKPCLKGTTALFFSNVANAPAKLIKEFGKEGIPALKGAYAEEGFYVGAEHLATLCAIKSKNEVIADIVGLLQSPLRNILSGLEARFDKEEGAAE